MPVEENKEQSEEGGTVASEEIAALEKENASLRASFEPLYAEIGRNFYEKPEGYELAITETVQKLVIHCQPILYLLGNIPIYVIFCDFLHNSGTFLRFMWDAIPSFLSLLRMPLHRFFPAFYRKPLFFMPTAITIYFHSFSVRKHIYPMQAAGYPYRSRRSGIFTRSRRAMSLRLRKPCRNLSGWTTRFTGITCAPCG